jgi:hypothetical protein
MRAPRTLACVAALIALTAAACGGDDDDDGSGSGTTEPAGGQGAEDDPRTESERQADEDAAEAMLLTLDDFPAGWQEGETDEDEEEEEFEELQADLADCLGVDPDELNPDNPTATSPSFTSPDDEEVSVEVNFTASTEAANRGFELLNDDATPGCYGEALQAVIEETAAQEGLPEGVEFGDTTFNRLSFDRLGDDSLAFRITLPVSAEGVDVDLFFDVVFARVGRIAIEGSFQSVFAPFDEEQAAELMRTVIDRAPTEEGG